VTAMVRSLPSGVGAHPAHWGSLRRDWRQGTANVRYGQTQSRWDPGCMTGLHPVSELTVGSTEGRRSAKSSGSGVDRRPSGSPSISDILLRRREPPLRARNGHRPGLFDHLVGAAKYPAAVPNDQIPIAPAAISVPTSRDFVTWRFSDAGRISAWMVSASRRPKTCT
jgi:hypothetical protein